MEFVHAERALPPIPILGVTSTDTPRSAQRVKRCGLALLFKHAHPCLRHSWERARGRSSNRKPPAGGRRHSRRRRCPALLFVCDADRRGERRVACRVRLDAAGQHGRADDARGACRSTRGCSATPTLERVSHRPQSTTHIHATSHTRWPLSTLLRETLFVHRSPASS